MMRPIRMPLFFMAAALLFSTPIAARAQRAGSQHGVSVPDSDGSGAYRTGHYRNLFAEQGHTAEQTRAKIDAAFNQFFHGDKKTQALYYEVGSNANGPLAYITDVANHDARTEGMSYGMMIAVQMNKKHEFDAIWNWASSSPIRRIHLSATSPGPCTPTARHAPTHPRPTAKSTL